MSANCYLPKDLTKMYRSEFFIAGLDPEFDIYVDMVSLDYFVRDASWIHDANTRINELRKTDLALLNMG